MANKKPPTQGGVSEARVRRSTHRLTRNVTASWCGMGIPFPPAGSRLH